MTKQELVEFIAKEANLTKADALAALEATLKGITAGLKKDGKEYRLWYCLSNFK